MYHADYLERCVSHILNIDKPDSLSPLLLLHLDLNFIVSLYQAKASINFQLQVKRSLCKTIIIYCTVTLCS